MPEKPPWTNRFEIDQALRGAIASVSLSHEQDCNCDVCKAGRGDEAAFQRFAQQAREKSQRARKQP